MIKEAVLQKFSGNPEEKSEEEKGDPEDNQWRETIQELCWCGTSLTPEKGLC
jgi:hypothetical protein